MTYRIPLDFLNLDTIFEKGCVGIVRNNFVLLSEDDSVIYLKKGEEETRGCISKEGTDAIQKFINFLNGKAGNWFTEVSGDKLYFICELNSVTKIKFKIEMEENNIKYNNISQLLENVEDSKNVVEIPFSESSQTAQNLIQIFNHFKKNSAVHIINETRDLLKIEDADIIIELNIKPSPKPLSINTTIKIDSIIPFLKYISGNSKKIELWTEGENYPLIIKSTNKHTYNLNTEYLIIAPYINQEINTEPPSGETTISCVENTSEEEPFFSEEGANVSVTSVTSVTCVGVSFTPAFTSAFNISEESTAG